MKRYEYKVYTSGGSYIGTWPDVNSDFDLKEELNAAGSPMDVILARPADQSGSDVAVDLNVKVYVFDDVHPQGVGKVRNVGLDLRRWQSTVRVRAESLLSGSLPARSRLSSRPGQRGLAVPLPAIPRHSARDCHVSTGASAQLRRLISDFADPLRGHPG